MSSLFASASAIVICLSGSPSLAANDLQQMTVDPAPLMDLAEGGKVDEGTTINRALQEGRRNAAAKRALQADLPHGEYNRANPMVPTASNAGQPGSLFKGLSRGFGRTFRDMSSETARARAFKEDPEIGKKVDTEKGYFFAGDRTGRVE